MVICIYDGSAVPVLDLITDVSSKNGLPLSFSSLLLLLLFLLLLLLLLTFIFLMTI